MLILLQLQERNCIFEVGSSGYNAFVSLLESEPMLCSNQIMMMNASHLTVHGITLNIGDGIFTIIIQDDLEDGKPQGEEEE